MFEIFGVMEIVIPQKSHSKGNFGTQSETRQGLTWSSNLVKNFLSA